MEYQGKGSIEEHIGKGSVEESSGKGVKEEVKSKGDVNYVLFYYTGSSFGDENYTDIRGQYFA